MSTTTPRYVIACDHQQLVTISEALHFMARVHMGQFEEIIDQVTVFRTKRLAPPGEDYSDEGYERAQFEARALRQTLFPELSAASGAYHGIADGRIPEIAPLAWDIHQVLRRAIAYAQTPNPDKFLSNSIPFREPFFCRSQHTPVTVTADAG